MGMMHLRTLCNIYIPLLLWNNKQNQIHFWECYYKNVFNHFMVLVLYLIIYFYVFSCNYSFLFAVCFCVCVLFSVFESLLGSSVLVDIIIMVMIIFSLTHFFSVIFFSGSFQWHTVSTLSILLFSLKKQSRLQTGLQQHILLCRHCKYLFCQKKK